MANFSDIVKMDEFRGLPSGEQSKALKKLFPDFAGLPEREQQKVLYRISANAPAITKPVAREGVPFEGKTPLKEVSGVTGKPVATGEAQDLAPFAQRHPKIAEFRENHPILSGVAEAAYLGQTPGTLEMGVPGTVPVSQPSYLVKAIIDKLKSGRLGGPARFASAVSDKATELRLKAKGFPEGGEQIKPSANIARKTKYGGPAEPTSKFAGRPERVGKAVESVAEETEKPVEPFKVNPNIARKTKFGGPAKTQASAPAYGNPKMGGKLKAPETAVPKKATAPEKAAAVTGPKSGVLHRDNLAAGILKDVPNITGEAFLKLSDAEKNALIQHYNPKSAAAKITDPATFKEFADWIDRLRANPKNRLSAP